MNPVIIGNATLHLGDCIEVMAGLPDNSLDSIICDPPYLISFMSKSFDTQHKSLPGSNEGQKMQEWHRRWVTEAYRILKPGGHLAAFGGDRTHHRLMSAMEDVGFELRQNCYWCFGSGFPKSLDAGKAIDKMKGAVRDIVGYRENICRTKNRIESSSFNGVTEGGMFRPDRDKFAETIASTPEAKQWSGYGTALKPATEIIAIGRKPMIGTLAENLLEWGTGAMNLDACRVEANGDKLGGGMVSKGRPKSSEGWDRPWMHDKEVTDRKKIESSIKVEQAESLGRFPPHLLHDGSDVVKKCFPDARSNCNKTNDKSGHKNEYVGGTLLNKVSSSCYTDSGSASRFFPSLPYDEEDCATLFYCAKASRTDRNEGCEMIESKSVESRNTFSSLPDLRMNHEQQRLPSHNHHVSVKPTSLMKWICRLLTPKGGTLLDPFMGSGSTLKAAVLENFTCIGIEMDVDYFAIAEARVAHVSPEVYVTPSRPERAEAAPRQQSMF